MNIEIANKLVELRKKAGLSQEELAEKLNVSRQAVSKWERAEASPDMDNLIALSKLYNVSLDDLVLIESKESKPEQEVEETPVENDEEGEGEIVVDEDVVIDENGHKRKLTQGDKIAISISGLFFPLGIIAFLILGFTWTQDNMGWRFGWTLILDAIWLSSLVPVIHKRKLTAFAYPIFAVALYCSLGILGGYYGFNGWGVHWYLFLTIPVYYILAANLQRLWQK